jgi:hypothetical protein
LHHRRRLPPTEAKEERAQGQGEEKGAEAAFHGSTPASAAKIPASSVPPGI